MHSGIIRMIRFLKMKNRKALIQSNLFLYSMHTSSLKCPSSSLCSNVLNGRAPHRSILLHPWGKSFSGRNFSWLSLKCFLLSSIHLPWFCFLPNKRDTTASCVSGAPRPSTRALICYRDSRTQHAAALLPTLDTSEQVQSKAAQAQRHTGRSPEETRDKPPRAPPLLPQRRGVLISAKCCQSGELLGDSLPGSHQHSKRPEGKQAMGRSHTPCTRSLGTESHSYQGVVGILLKSKFPRCQPRANLARKLSKNSSFRPATVNSFLHTILSVSFWYFHAVLLCLSFAFLLLFSVNQFFLWKFPDSSSVSIPLTWPLASLCAS